MPGRSQQDNATVARLLEAAADEFARRGYVAARIRDIVEAAGANLAAVNYHFGGKDGLYRATIASLALKAQDDLPGESREYRALPPEDQLRAFTLTMVRRYLGARRSAPLSSIIAHELLDPTPAFGQVVRGVAGPQWDRVQAIVRRILGKHATQEDVALACLSTVGQCVFFLYGRRLFEERFAGLAARPDAVERIAAHIADFSVAAMHARREGIEDAHARAAAATARPGKGARPRPLPLKRTRRAPGKAEPASG